MRMRRDCFEGREHPSQWSTCSSIFFSLSDPSEFSSIPIPAHDRSLRHDSKHLKATPVGFTICSQREHRLHEWEQFCVKISSEKFNTHTCFNVQRQFPLALSASLLRGYRAHDVILQEL